MGDEEELKDALKEELIDFLEELWEHFPEVEKEKFSEAVNSVMPEVLEELEAPKE